jgi:hypothetical protein
MPEALIRLQEENRTTRRSIADAIDVVSRLGLPSGPIGRIQIGPLQIPSGDRTYLVEVGFHQVDALCRYRHPLGSKRGV